MCDYDAVVIGAGPHGLAALSALHAPFLGLSDHDREKLTRARPAGSPRVAVVDPSGEWMCGWNGRFAKQDIRWLRSPLLAHPDMTSTNALLEFAMLHGREAEVHGSSLEGTSLKGLWEVDSGLYNLPGTELFRDFCEDLAAKLPHTMVRAAALGACKEADGVYRVRLSNNDTVTCKALFIAAGNQGVPVWPRPFDTASIRESGLVSHLDELVTLSPPEPPRTDASTDGVLVVGGGLSAVQAALRLVRQGAKAVTLCSRRPLQTRQFDVSLDWVDRRRSNLLRHRFFQLPLEQRLEKVMHARGGGTVPAEYVAQVEAACKRGHLKVLVDTVTAAAAPAGPQGPVAVTFAAHGDERAFDGVILATGIKTGCGPASWVSNLAKELDLPLRLGFPVLNSDTKWGDEQVYVLGSLASTVLGPDAGNLMGARMAAELSVEDARQYLSDGASRRPETTKQCDMGAFQRLNNRFSLLAAAGDRF